MLIVLMKYIYSEIHCLFPRRMNCQGKFTEHVCLFFHFSFSFQNVSSNFQDQLPMIAKYYFVVGWVLCNWFISGFLKFPMNTASSAKPNQAQTRSNQNESNIIFFSEQNHLLVFNLYYKVVCQQQFGSSQFCAGI